MHDTSRRSLLADFSAISAATVAAALPVPVLAHPAADPDIIAMTRRIVRLTVLDTEAANQFAEAYDARNTDPERFTRAERLSNWLQERVKRAAAILTLMRPQSLAGTVAKAEAFQAIQASGWEHCVAEWRDDLAASIVSDVLRIGGQANV